MSTTQANSQAHQQRLSDMAAYIERHGFAPAIDYGARCVSFAVPTIDGQGREGWETCTVHTFTETRAALGY